MRKSLRALASRRGRQFLVVGLLLAGTAGIAKLQTYCSNEDGSIRVTCSDSAGCWVHTSGGSAQVSRTAAKIICQGFF